MTQPPTSPVTEAAKLARIKAVLNGNPVNATYPALRAKIARIQAIIDAGTSYVTGPRQPVVAVSLEGDEKMVEELVGLAERFHRDKRYYAGDLRVDIRKILAAHRQGQEGEVERLRDVAAYLLSEAMQPPLEQQWSDGISMAREALKLAGGGE